MDLTLKETVELQCGDTKIKLIVDDMNKVTIGEDYWCSLTDDLLKIKIYGFDFVVEKNKFKEFDMGITERIDLLNEAIVEPIKFDYRCEKLMAEVDAMMFANIATGGDKIRNIYTNKKKGVTVVIFNDNTKYEFRLSKGDKYDIDKVILMALVRKQQGLQNNSQYNKFMQELRNKVEPND